MKQWIYTDEQFNDITQFSCEVEILKNFCCIINDRTWAKLIHDTPTQDDYDDLSTMTEILEHIAKELDEHVSKITKYGVPVELNA